MLAWLVGWHPHHAEKWGESDALPGVAGGDEGAPVDFPYQGRLYRGHIQLPVQWSIWLPAVVHPHVSGRRSMKRTARAIPGIAPRTAIGPHRQWPRRSLNIVGRRSPTNS